MHRQPFLLICFIFIISLYSYGEEVKNSPLFLDAGTQRGYFLNTNDFVDGTNFQHKKLTTYDALNLRLGFQTNEAKEWQQIYNRPCYGVGLFLPFFPNNEELGRPVSLYGFWGNTIFRLNRLTLTYEANFGFSYGWEPYNQVTNPYNKMMGARWSWHTGLNLAFEYQLSPLFSIQAGTGMMHFSNGSLQLPNKGLNLASSYLTIRRYLQPYTPAERIKVPYKGPSSGFFISLSMGVQQVQRDTIYTHLPDHYVDRHFWVNTLTAGWEKQFSRKWKYLAGIDLTYDEVKNSLIEADKNGDPQLLNKEISDKLSAGIFAGCEMVIDNFSFFFHTGLPLWKNHKLNRPEENYQRIGIKHHIGNRLFMGVHLKMRDYGRADYVQCTAGVRI